MTVTYSVVASESAQREFDSIIDYIAFDSFQNADLVADRFDEVFMSLRTDPYRHKVVGTSRPRRLDVRSTHESNYVLYYLVFEQSRQVQVIKIRRGSRRQPRSFRDDEP